MIKFVCLCVRTVKSHSNEQPLITKPLNDFACLCVGHLEGVCVRERDRERERKRERERERERETASCFEEVNSSWHPFIYYCS
jgi:hypothetical protein